MNHSTKSQEVKIYSVCRLQCRRTNLVPLLSISMVSPNCHKGMNTEGEVILIQVKWAPGIQLPRPSLTDGDTLSWRLNLFKQPKECKFCIGLYLHPPAAERVFISCSRENEAVLLNTGLDAFSLQCRHLWVLAFVAWRNQSEFKSWHSTFTC